MFFYLLLLAIIVFFVVGMFLVLLEFIKFQRNPVCLMINHDKRFAEVDHTHIHKFNEIERGE